MIYNDAWIRANLEYLFPPQFEGNDINAEEQVQPASLDIRLGSDFRTYSESHNVGTNETVSVYDPALQDYIYLPCFDPLTMNAQQFMEEKRLGFNGAITVMPGHEGFLLGTTMESIVMPDDVVARVEGRSSLGRLGLRVHSTAGFIDPGFRGQITLEIDLVGKYPVRLTPGMRIAQLSFEPLNAPAEAPYGVKKNSKYQDQRGATTSRSYKDL